MLPELDYLKVLRRTKFPFFILPSNEIRYEDGLVFLNTLVLDDRNQEGNTLGKRRLKTPHKLYKLKSRVANFKELIDCRKSHFIDNRGFYFTYVKTKFAVVKSQKIVKKTSYGSHTTIFCKNVNYFFVLPSFPRTAEWAQILYLDDLPWMIYSTSDSFVDQYKRKI
jgi:hypothetical protein